MQVELRHLQVIRSVADAGSISRAATQLRIAQSGLTAQVQRIEQELGGALFRRTTSGVALTELGEHVVARARDVLAQFDDLVESAKVLAVQDEPAAAIHVVGPLGPITPMLAGAVRELLPDREQVTQIAHTPETINEALETAGFDVAVCGQQPSVPIQLPPGLHSRNLVNETAYIGLSASHRLADRMALRLADLADEDWVLPNEKLSGLTTALRLACEEAGFTPRCRHRGADMATAAMMVRCGHAIAAFYPSAVTVPGMVLRPLVGNPLQRTMQLVWRPSSPVAGLADLVHAKVVKRYQTLVHDHPVYAAWWEAEAGS
ncbi:LysR family transcriptional regulator [Kutzneria sp. CA-103260]|uniref:LysR family transcriptional regulator n=1 Tax=Kutzneria sp. CA-103260 TaxID=2802641 RepID=UPI001BA909F7|nr:LysR family transcriptional regulator [Kutzneria sp. CA-103260]QUQ67370.1 LysR family transcriptional regulator [Kutzneria sp. CA-103260]